LTSCKPVSFSRGTLLYGVSKYDAEANPLSCTQGKRDMNKKVAFFQSVCTAVLVKFIVSVFLPKLRVLQTWALFLQDPVYAPTPGDYSTWKIFEVCILTILRCVSSEHWCIPPGHSAELYNFMALEY
jgi:hypothetical protein